jgi:serine/threonine protein kinase
VVTTLIFRSGQRTRNRLVAIPVAADPVRLTDTGINHPGGSLPAEASGRLCRVCHRVDGRSDIFSLGVVFYELLTGRRPFSAKAKDKDEARNELRDLIATAEARPPRQVDDTIPKELERICLKALSKRATERYNTALDMAEDLRIFLQTVRGKMTRRNRPEWVRSEMERLHDRVMKVRDREPGGVAAQRSGTLRRVTSWFSERLRRPKRPRG